MLKLETSPRQSVRAAEPSANFLPQLDLLSLARLFPRHWPRFVTIFLTIVALSVVYDLTAFRRYSATFDILVSVKNKDLLANNEGNQSGEGLVDPGAIESQVEILKSSSVIEDAVRKLNLMHNDEFMSAGRTALNDMVSQVFSKFSPAEGPPSESALVEAAVEKVTSDLKVKRLGLTYVIEATYRAYSPQMAVSIANAVADSFLNSELKARYESSRRATQWFEDRLVELRRNVSETDLAVQKYRIANNIVDTARGPIGESQLADMSSQLVVAEEATSDAKARLDSVQTVLNGDFTSAAVAEALKSDVITRLRAQYLDLSSKAGELSQRYGKDHQVVLDIQRQMKEVANSARDELQRIAQSDQSDLNIAMQHEKSLRESVKELISKVGDTNRSGVTLRNLESSSQAYRNMYDAFLQKFQQTAQEQTAPFDAARLITAPILPDKPSWPRFSIVFGGGVALGAILGFAGMLLKEMFNTGFRTPDDVRNFAGLECLGTLPRISRRRAKIATDRMFRDQKLILGRDSAISRQTVLEPFSRFTETLRNVKVSIDLEVKSGVPPIIGVVSAVPKEGKTTVCANMAQLTAQMGHKTLVIDGDFHTCSLTKALAPRATQGVLEALEDPSRLQELAMTDAITGLNFLPAVITTRLTNAAEVLNSNQMLALFAAARENYDYIYVDLPPLVPVVDAKAAAFNFDGFLYVIDWETTSRDVVRDAVSNAEFVRQRIIGAVLNKADPSQLRRIEAYRGPAYGSYYTESAST